MTYCCPACPLEFDDFEDYREHAKTEFGKMESFTKCCNHPSWFLDSNNKLRCDKCSKFTKLYEKFIEYIVPPQSSQHNFRGVSKE